MVAATARLSGSLAGDFHMEVKRDENWPDWCLSVARLFLDASYG